MKSFDQLRTELALWGDAGLVLQLWWRDDDAREDTPALHRLLELARHAGMEPALGVIPAQAQASLVSLLAPQRCVVWQHGWSHEFYSHGEFGDGRLVSALVQDALSGREAMDRLFGERGWQRVFVPPNHMLAMAFKSVVPALGYRGISAGTPLTSVLPHVCEVNAEIDVMDWPRGSALDPGALSTLMVHELRRRRLGEVPSHSPLGLLTHHLAFDEQSWGTVSALVELLVRHPVVRAVPAARLFHGQTQLDSSRPATDAAARPDKVLPVTVVITSCGRPDLLAKTLDSFFESNTCPIHSIIVMEDGEHPSALAASPAYGPRVSRWLSTGKRIGQIATIDCAYSEVTTAYLFHCEDDWEFTTPRFIERSLAVLETHPFIMQVWLRALTDTNGHPIDEQVYLAGDVPFRLMSPGFVSDGWGTWHGFSFNPGLRRMADYHRFGAFGDLAPSARARAFDVEGRASDLYLEHGYCAAILADDGGRGSVRHIGWGRRVADHLTPEALETPEG